MREGVGKNGRGRTREGAGKRARARAMGARKNAKRPSLPAPATRSTSPKRRHRHTPTDVRLCWRRRAGDDGGPVFFREAPKRARDAPPPLPDDAPAPLQPHLRRPGTCCPTARPRQWALERSPAPPARPRGARQRWRTWGERGWARGNRNRGAHSHVAVRARQTLTKARRVRVGRAWREVRRGEAASVFFRESCDARAGTHRAEATVEVCRSTVSFSFTPSQPAFWFGSHTTPAHSAHSYTN